MENTKKIIASDLMSEIKLLLQDHYIANIKKWGQEITITFLNGQKFTLILYEDET